MPDKLEEAALSGVLFQERSTSPSRSVSPDLSNPEEDEGDEDLNDRQRNRQSTTSTSALIPSSHDGHQTGTKGVLSDRAASERMQRTAAESAGKEAAARQARQAIIAPTVEDEAQLRMAEMRLKERQTGSRDDEDAEAKARWRRARWEEMEQARRKAGDPVAQEMGAEGVHLGKRGGLREIGQEGFITAVEQRGWVIVLIYEPDVTRCQTLLASMLHLSLNMPPASSLPTPLALYRARATSLRFSLLPPNSSSNLSTRNQRGPEDEEEEIEEAQPEGKPDPDVLPTVLAYKDGELEKTWIRADWDVSEDGIEGLLRREGILPRSDFDHDELDSEEE